MRYTSTGIPTGSYPSGRCGNSKFVVEVNRTPQEIKGYNIQTGECLFTHTYSYNQPEYASMGQYVSEEESWLAVKTYDSVGPSYGIRLYKITYSGIQYWNISLPIFIGSGDNFVVINGNVYLGISNRVQVSGTYYYDLNIYKVNLSNSSVSLIGQPRGSYRSTYMYVNVGFNPTSGIVWFHHNKTVAILNTANDSVISSSISHDDTFSSRLIMRGSDGNGYIIAYEYSSGYSYYLYKITTTSVIQSSLSVQNSTLFNQVHGKYPDRFDVTTKTISINHGQCKGSYYSINSNVGEYKDSSSYMINKNQVIQSQLMFGYPKPPICDSESYISSSNGVMFVSEWINNVDLIETSMLQNALLKAGTNSLMSINEDYTYSFTDSLIDEILS